MSDHDKRTARRSACDQCLHPRQLSCTSTHASVCSTLACNLSSSFVHHRSSSLFSRCCSHSCCPSLAAVRHTIASHHGGYDDSRFLSRGKSFNLLPAYTNHLAAIEDDHDPKFLGAQIKCETLDPDKKSFCGSRLDPYTQHYTYKILAQHFLAVCYYGSNYSDDKRFESWKQYTRGDGYCTRIKVPTREQVEEKL